MTKISDQRRMVTEFALAMGHPVSVSLEPVLLDFRMKLIGEESSEVADAITQLGDELPGGPFLETAKQDVAKELADLLYVIYGMASAFDIDIDEAFRRVHKSNMSKLGDDGKPVYRADGKVMKGPNYRKPDMGGTW